MNKIYLVLIAFVFALGLILAVGQNGAMIGQDNDSDDDDLEDTEDSLDEEDEDDEEDEEVETENKGEDDLEDRESKGDKIRIRNFEVYSKLNITEEEIENKTRLRVRLSNGLNSEIKVMPNTASEKALEVLRAKCDERNCSIELKEVGQGNQTRAAYQVHAEKETKVLGLFKTRMRVEAQVDAETGEVMQTKKPWWAFLAKED